MNAYGPFYDIFKFLHMISTPILINNETCPINFEIFSVIRPGIIIMVGNVHYKYIFALTTCKIYKYYLLQPTSEYEKSPKRRNVPDFYLLTEKRNTFFK
ncbi:MAG TPA: hypothetical protein DEQ64_18970 [Lachnoclostridium sp.]|nr:hypothetical protein [Lachnoclostridium sp.]